MSQDTYRFALDTFTQRTKAAYQSGSLLEGTVRVEKSNGKTHRFDVLGKKGAITRGSQQPVVFANFDGATPTCAPYYRCQFEPLDVQDEAVISSDKAGRIGDNVGLAVARSKDGDVLKALAVEPQNAANDAYSPMVRAIGGTGNLVAMTNANTTVTSAGTTAAANGNGRGGSRMDVHSIAEAAATLMNRGVPRRDDITWVMPWARFVDLAVLTGLSSSDFLQGNGMTEAGKLMSKLFGVRVVFVDDEARLDADDGGFDSPLTSWMYGMDAVGMAKNMERVGIREWRPDIQSWQYGASAICDATRIDNAGILKVVFASAIPT